jgi:hypothetical protein
LVLHFKRDVAAQCLLCPVVDHPSGILRISLVYWNFSSTSEPADNMPTGLESLPTEILVEIAELCTFDLDPPLSYYANPSNYLRSHNALARTSLRLYDALNGELYKQNLDRDPPTHSCVLWAVHHGRLDTLARAASYGAALDTTIEVDEFAE